MPNWVTNDLTIRKQDKHLVLNENNEMDFNILIPMPEGFKNSVAGGCIDDCMEYYRLKTANKDLKRQAELLERIGKNPHMFGDELWQDEHPTHSAEEIGKYYTDLQEKYGCHDWYEWSYANWGVKWNASDTDIVNLDNGLLSIRFNTPWGTPNIFLEKLAEKIPFHLAWEEEQGYRGIIYAEKQGAIEDIDLPMLEWEEDEHGDYERVEDEYGEDWFELDMEFMKDTLNPDYQFDDKDFELERLL